MHNPVVTSLFCVCLKYTCAESVYPVYAVSYLDSQDLGEIMAVGGGMASVEREPIMGV